MLIVTHHGGDTIRMLDDISFTVLPIDDTAMKLTAQLRGGRDTNPCTSDRPLFDCQSRNTRVSNP